MADKNNYKYKAYIVGDALLKKRKSMLKTQEEFAEMIGIDPKRVRELENGNSFPHFITAIKIRKELGISIDKLIDEINDDMAGK